ncbi:MAG: hypothetical protein AAF492_12965 [Verrucomicrobiota bacterium]
MVKNILSDIGGIGLYGIVALVLFFGVFVSMLVMVFAMKSRHAQRMGALPLDLDGRTIEGGDRHE